MSPQLDKLQVLRGQLKRCLRGGTYSKTAKIVRLRSLELDRAWELSRP